MESPKHWKGFLYLLVVTVVAVLIVEPLIEKVSMTLTGRSAESLLTFGKAAS